MSGPGKKTQSWYYRCKVCHICIVDRAQFLDHKRKNHLDGNAALSIQVPAALAPIVRDLITKYESKGRSGRRSGYSGARFQDLNPGSSNNDETMLCQVDTGTRSSLYTPPNSAASSRLKVQWKLRGFSTNKKASKSPAVHSQSKSKPPSNSGQQVTASTSKLTDSQLTPTVKVTNSRVVSSLNQPTPKAKHLAGKSRPGCNLMLEKDTSFRESLLLTAHKNNAAARKDQLSGQPNEIKTEFSCYFCDKKHTDFGRHLRHFNRHTREHSFKCPHCDQRFISVRSMKGHVTSFHRQG